MRHFFLTLLALLLGAVSACAQSAPPPPPPPVPDYFPDSWKEYVYEKDGVKFRFPAKPEIKAEVLKVGSEDATAHSYHHHSFIDLLVGMTEYPPSRNLEAVPPEQFLGSLRDFILASIKDKNPKVIREADVMVDGRPAKFLHIELNGDRVIRFKFFAVKNRIYLASVDVKKGEKHAFNYENDFEKVAMAFLDSVRLVSPAR